MSYRHVQTALLMYLISGAGAVVALIGIVGGGELGGGRWWLVAVGMMMIVTGAVAARLTVTVDGRAVTASFGWGWPTRRIEVGEIASAVRVRNSWWHGWGIRKVSHGWMYNNAGREAVELSLRSGKVFRIGTDDPAELLAAVERVRRPG